MSFRHNKKRNAGLVYEFLVRRMASQMLAQDSSGYQKTFQITKRYYSEGQPLASELELFETIRSTRGVSENVARKVLGEVKNHAAKLDHKLLEIKKSNLIKEVNYTFGKDFFSSHRIPEYRLLASIQMYIGGDSETLSESATRAQLEEGLVKFMTTKEPVAQPQRDEKEVDNLVISLAAKKFQERYGKSLNKDQKVILEKYMLATVAGADMAPLLEHVEQERKRLLLVLNRSKVLKEFRDDAVMKERLNEACDRLRDDVPGMSLDGQVEEIMLYHRLVGELSADE